MFFQFVDYVKDVVRRVAACVRQRVVRMLPMRVVSASRIVWTPLAVESKKGPLYKRAFSFIVVALIISR